MKLKYILLTVVLFAHHSLGGMVSYLRFEENGGDIAYDETGLLDGDLISFTPDQESPGGGDTYGRGWSTDIPCSTIPLTSEANTTSMRMNGGSAYIDLSNYNNLLLGFSFTIEMFIKPDENAAQYGATIFGFGSDISDKLFFGIGNDSGQSFFRMQFMDTQVFFDTDEIRFNDWQHVALIKEAGEYSIYLDGQLLVNNTLSSTLDGPYEFYGDPTLGTRTIGGESGTFRGWLDEFRISDEALTPDQFLNAAIPEPATTSLLFTGLMALALGIRKESVEQMGAGYPPHCVGSPDP